MRYVLAAIFLAISTTAIAQPLPPIPQFDVDRLCLELIAQSNAPSIDKETLFRNQNKKGAFNECIRLEQNAYDYVKYIWPKLSDRSRRECSEIGADVKIKYQQMENCVSVFYQRDARERERAAPPAQFRK